MKRSFSECSALPAWLRIMKKKRMPFVLAKTVILKPFAAINVEGSGKPNVFIN